MNRIKCSGVCDQFYCNDCLEAWEDGFKACPQCIVYEKELRSETGKAYKVKKVRISPQQKVAEQFLAMKKAYEEKLQQQQQELANNTSSTQQSTSEHESKATTPRDKK